MKIASILILLFSSTLLNGQVLYIGNLMDNKTKEIVPYANIGVVGKDIGTVSNENGEFKIKLDNSYNNDTLQISAIGYKDLIFRVDNFKEQITENQTIELAPQAVELKEIVVSEKELNEVVLGNKTTSKFMSLGFTTDELGNELGIKIKIKKSPTYIKEFKANITMNPNDSLKFRLNFYDIKKRIPNKKINTQDIFFVTHVKEGQLSIDLSDYNIVVEDNFFVTLEWIEDLDNKLRFSASRFGGTIIHRKTSQGKWAKLKIVSVGFNVTALH